MPKPLPTISIVPSRIEAGLQGTAIVGIMGLMAWLGPWWLWLLAGVAAMIPIRGIWRTPPWRLRQVCSGTGCHWEQETDGKWRPVSLKVVRLGPALIGLVIEGRYCWLWPDSSSPQALRRLRQTLVWPPSGAGDEVSLL
ncbi:hypothetical protein GCM10027040_35170 [Halomonas shantousis]